MAAVKTLPVSEDGHGAALIAPDGKRYVISQRVSDHRFTLWAETDGGYDKLAVSKDSPAPLMQRVFGKRK